mmetsp:Transcript_8205/g.33775  ORF Transcript_8205/g.33775 Transcript_8205/m.33775 type:complete len:486 (+) Transcript_8205:362-1819(+)
MVEMPEGRDVAVLEVGLAAPRVRGLEAILDRAEAHRGEDAVELVVARLLVLVVDVLAVLDLLRRGVDAVLVAQLGAQPLSERRGRRVRELLVELGEVRPVSLTGLDAIRPVEDLARRVGERDDLVGLARPLPREHHVVAARVAGVRDALDGGFLALERLDARLESEPHERRFHVGAALLALLLELGALLAVAVVPVGLLARSRAVPPRLAGRTLEHARLAAAPRVALPRLVVVLARARRRLLLRRLLFGGFFLLGRGARLLSRLGGPHRSRRRRCWRLLGALLFGRFFCVGRFGGAGSGLLLFGFEEALALHVGRRRRLLRVRPRRRLGHRRRVGGLRRPLGRRRRRIVAFASLVVGCAAVRFGEVEAEGVAHLLAEFGELVRVEALLILEDLPSDGARLVRREAFELLEARLHLFGELGRALALLRSQLVVDPRLVGTLLRARFCGSAPPVLVATARRRRPHRGSRRRRRPRFPRWWYARRRRL